MRSHEPAEHALCRPQDGFAQQDIQAAHSIREELVGHSTAKANQIRGLVEDLQQILSA